MDHSDITDRMNDAQKRFEKACQQILLLDQQIKDLEARYNRAVSNRKNSFRYNLRLKLSVVTGVKMMYHHYASTKADEIQRLRNDGRHIRNDAASSYSRSRPRSHNSGSRTATSSATSGHPKPSVPRP